MTEKQNLKRAFVDVLLAKLEEDALARAALPRARVTRLAIAMSAEQPGGPALASPLCSDVFGGEGLRALLVQLSGRQMKHGRSSTTPALLAGLPVTVAGNTVNRLCASGLAAVVGACSALSIMLRAIRSLMDPVGLCPSSLANRRTEELGLRFFISTRGVWPMASIMLL